MDKYAARMRELKMKKAKEAVGKQLSDADKAAEMKRALDEQFGEAVVNAATAALAQRWVRLAKESLETKFRSRSEQIRNDLQAALSQMPEQDDWLEGNELLTRGMDLNNDRRTLEAEAAIKIRRVQTDLKEYLKDKEMQMDKERKAFELNIATGNDRSTLEIETRQAELEKSKQEKRKEFDKEEKRARDEQGAAPTEMIQAHRAHIAEMEQAARDEAKRARDARAADVNLSRVNFDRQEALQHDEMSRRKNMAADNVDRIRSELAGRVKASESDWQNSSAKWLTVANKKIQVK
ncbi:unnamed protein product, partial [Symbiodinium microadriaticum]